MARRKKLGRPSKLTKQVIERLEQALSAGSFIDAACTYAGISHTSFYRWLDKGEDADIEEKDNDYRTFFLRIKKTLAKSEMYSLSVIAKAEEEGDWRAAAWKLERRFPDRWGTRGWKVQSNVNMDVHQIDDSSDREERIKRISEMLAHIPDDQTASDQTKDKEKYPEPEPEPVSPPELEIITPEKKKRKRVELELLT